MNRITENSLSTNNSSKKKEKKDFLYEKLQINSKEFALLEKEVNIKNYEAQAIAKKCLDLSKKSLEALEKQDDDKDIENISTCAMSLSEIKSWLERSLDNNDLNSEINDLINYFDNLNEMMEKMEFLDSIQSESEEAQKKFIGHLKKRREMHNKL